MLNKPIILAKSFVMRSFRKYGASSRPRRVPRITREQRERVGKIKQACVFVFNKMVPMALMPTVFYGIIVCIRRTKQVTSPAWTYCPSSRGQISDSLI